MTQISRPEAMTARPYPARRPR
ncbi:MAG: hypothetical protein QOF38_1946, partial [Pseudonocardiales bacterium]|nr:hypothetical protein [Pseudonocardiales bacterium]